MKKFFLKFDKTGKLSARSVPQTNMDISLHTGYFFPFPPHTPASPKATHKTFEAVGYQGNTCSLSLSRSHYEKIDFGQIVIM